MNEAKKVSELPVLLQPNANTMFVVDHYNSNTGTSNTYTVTLSLVDQSLNNIHFQSVNTDIIPAQNSVFSLGNSSLQWESLYVSANTIYVGNTPLSVSNGTLLVNNSPIVPYATPSIQYTGVFNGYPSILPVTSGQNAIYTSNGALASNSNYWFWNDQFYDGRYDLSGTISLTLQNIGGIVGQFNFGGKANPVLTTIDLGQVSYIGSNYYIHNLPSLTNFYANNLSYVAGDFNIYYITSPSANFNFNNLIWINGWLYLQSNDTLTTIPSFPSLQHIGYGLYINDNNSFNGTISFSALTFLNYIYYYSNQNLSLSCDNITTAQFISIYNNNMPYGPSFTNLHTMFGEFQCYNNTNQVTPPNLPNLQYCYNRIYLYSSQQMTTAPALPNLIELHGDFTMDDCTACVNGFNFNSLKLFSGNFNASTCAFNQTTVDYILTKLASLDGTNGTTLFTGSVNVSGGTSSTPSTAGLAAAATLTARGCSVSYNS